MIEHLCSGATRCKSAECYHAKPHEAKDCNSQAPCGCWPNDPNFKPRVICKPVSELKPREIITIGIDPDMIASGLAVVSGKQITKLHSVRLPNLVATIQAIGSPDEVIIKLENPEANKGLFASHAAKNKAVSIKVAMSVGKVQSTAHHIQEMLIAAGYPVKLVTPLKGPLKRQAKDDAEYFNRITGWTGRSNQDQRDAALIALWG